MAGKLKPGWELTFDEYLERYYGTGFVEKAKANPALLDYMCSWFQLDLMKWKNDKKDGAEKASEDDINNAVVKVMKGRIGLSRDDFQALIDAHRQNFVKLAIKEEMENWFAGGYPRSYEQAILKNPYFDPNKLAG